MRILHTADWHLGKKLENYSRFEEQKEVLDEICRIADEQNADVIIVAGDLYDTFNPPSEAEQLLYSTFFRLTNGGNRPVVAIAGNHDSPERVITTDPLALACCILIAGYPNAEFTPQTLGNGIRITRADKGFLELQLPQFNYPLRLLLTPFASELRLRTRISDENGDGSGLRDLLKAQWQQTADTYCDNKGVNMLAAHLFVMQQNGEKSEEPEDERPILQIGTAQAIYTNILPAQIQYIALGHLHRKHIVPGIPAPVYYSGSPLAYSFSEENQDKYVLIIDAEPDKPVLVNPVSLKSGKRLLRKRCHSSAEALEWLESVPDALVELTIVTDTALTGGEQRILREAHKGIISIIPEVRTMNGNGEISEAAPDLNLNMETLFSQFYSSQNGGQLPSVTLLGLFREMQNLSE